MIGAALAETTKSPRTTINGYGSEGVYEVVSVKGGGFEGDLKR
jgi:hypothetical protein